MKFILTAMLALTLSACGDDRWTDYSYKMTVYVGDEAYSTVRHVEVEEGSTIQSSTGRRVDRRVEGEAVVIDTPSGPVFALMTPAEGDFGFGRYAAYVAEPALMADYGEPSEDIGPSSGKPGYDGLADDAARHNAMLTVEGPRDLPWKVPNPDTARGPKDIVVWPMFVRFGDIGDPSTVRQVSPASIGVTRITLELTGEDVPSALRDTLGWLDSYHDKMLDGQRINHSQALSNNLSPRAFRQEMKR